MDPPPETRAGGQRTQVDVAVRAHCMRVGGCVVLCQSYASITRHREAAQDNRRVDLERLAR